MRVRDESEGDFASVHRLNAAVFETAAEAQLVDALRASDAPLISLVAEIDGEVVGHILFSPVPLEGHAGLKLAGLGPMAVTPRLQNSGIGSALVEAGLQRCRDAGYGAVVVLGHPGYYPRFGFSASNLFGIRSEYEVPDEVFMLIELIDAYLSQCSGTIRYHPAFAAV